MFIQISFNQKLLKQDIPSNNYKTLLIMMGEHINMDIIAGLNALSMNTKKNNDLKIRLKYLNIN